jgi:hypothetical protein
MFCLAVTVCPPGSGGSSCNNCTAGSYSPGGNSTVPTPGCQSCETGLTLNNKVGATSIEDCVENCPSGTGGVNCTTCLKKTYSLGGPGAECSACSVNWTTVSTGGNSCSVCEAGYGGGSCGICALGTFSTGGSIAGCTACVANFTTLSTGSTSSANCSGVLGVL